MKGLRQQQEANRPRPTTDPPAACATVRAARGSRLGTSVRLREARFQ